LYAILKAAGYFVGVFTSPHLVDFRERICVNGEMISKEDAKRLGEKLLSMDFGVHPTMFDYCLAMALLYFKEQGCDIVLLETGLGGRLDSTNAVGTPLVSVITKIGYDHMAILGNSLPEIAAEKAGILKKGTVFVTESQEKEVKEVLLQAAREVGVAETIQMDWADIKEMDMDETGAHFSFREYKGLSMQMFGVHQYENAAAAILAAQAIFKKKGMPKERWDAAIRTGIASAKWPGRMEILKNEPYFMVDGAHNSNGVEALKKSLMAMFPGERFHFIMGVMADKDYGKMIEALLPIAKDFVTVTVESERALQSDALAACIREKGIPAESCRDLKACLDFEKWKNDNKTIAFGSLYFVGEIKSYLQ
jgi:dihydrofolate synthase/folylpolyglutamate synthase